MEIAIVRAAHLQIYLDELGEIGVPVKLRSPGAASLSGPLKTLMPMSALRSTSKGWRVAAATSI